MKFLSKFSIFLRNALIIDGKFNYRSYNNNRFLYISNIRIAYHEDRIDVIELFERGSDGYDRLGEISFHDFKKIMKHILFMKKFLSEFTIKIREKSYIKYLCIYVNSETKEIDIRVFWNESIMLHTGSNIEEFRMIYNILVLKKTILLSRRSK